MTSVLSFWSVLSLAILGLVYLGGFIALVYCAKCAPEGYEDADGFRLGNKPRSTPKRVPGGEPAGVDSLGGTGHLA